jgi:hypothetical protein
MTETVFVEEYRKELSATGYPFTVFRPAVTATGYSLPIGTIADASVYCDTSSDILQLTEITKQDAAITFTVGRYLANTDLTTTNEVVELYDNVGVFGGILVLNLKKLPVLRSWKNGVHTITQPLTFCARCLEVIPVMGVHRFHVDSGQLAAGDVVLSGGRGCLLQLKTSPSGITHVETNYTGDPTYSIRMGDRLNKTPVQRVICKDTFDTEVTLLPDYWNGISVIACNTYQSTLHEDALRLETTGSTITISLGGI